MDIKYEYKSEYEFLDLSGLDDRTKGEINSFLNSGAETEVLQLPWDTGEVDYYQADVSQLDTDSNSSWQNYSTEQSQMRYEGEMETSATAVISTITQPHMYAHPPRQMMPQVYSSMVLPQPNVFEMDPEGRMHPFVPSHYQQSMYLQGTEIHEVSPHRDNRNKRNYRGRGNRRDANTSYMDPNSAMYPTYHHNQAQYQRYSRNMRSQTVYYPTEHTNSPRQCSYYPQGSVYASPLPHNAYNQVSQHSGVGSQYMRHAVVPPAPRPRPELPKNAIKRSGDPASRPATASTYGPPPSSIQRKPEPVSSSQTICHTTVIVNNKIEHSVSNEASECTSSNNINNQNTNNKSEVSNNSNNNNNNGNNSDKVPPVNVTIEHNIVATVNKNCELTEKADVPFVNINSSIQVKQNTEKNNVELRKETVSVVQTQSTEAELEPKPEPEPELKPEPVTVTKNEPQKESVKPNVPDTAETQEPSIVSPQLPATPVVQPATQIPQAVTLVVQPATQIPQAVTPVVQPATQIPQAVTPVSQAATPALQATTPVAQVVTQITQVVTPVPQVVSEASVMSWANVLKKSSADPSTPGISNGKPTARINPLRVDVASCSDNSPKLSSSPNEAPGTRQLQRKPRAFATVESNSNESTASIGTEVQEEYDASNKFDDLDAHKTGEFLSKYQMERQTVSLLPRGLINRSNYCYINSILQALLACPPFYNLLVALPYSKNTARRNTSNNLTTNMIRFVHEFSPLAAGARLARKDRAQKRSDEAVVHIQSGIAFEPTYVYTMLKNTSCASVFSVEGRQEDAEEFLSCLLNGISDEMLEMMKLGSNDPAPTPPENEFAEQNHGEEEEWKIMGPKNKGSITRCTEFGRTPLSDIFRGQLRYSVSRAGEQSTVNVQPFFTLQLDIEKAESVEGALEILVGRDQLEGMTCSKTKREIEAWKQVVLEELPVILILHLKWFDYKLDGCSKILKSVQFPIDLKIDNKILSPNAAKKLSLKQKQYKLFAVTYHDGKEATKGHYVTDAFHVGYGGWVRYDDSSLRGVSEHSVLNPSPPRVPYLLYYRRLDTIGNNQISNDRIR